jgi:hypothetical protein
VFFCTEESLSTVIWGLNGGYLSTLLSSESSFDVPAILLAALNALSENNSQDPKATKLGA